MSMNEREQLAKDNGMTIEFVNWFFDNKKDGCGNAWFIMMAAMWEGWSGREAKCAALAAENAALKSAIQTHSESVHFCELCGKDDPCSTDDVCMALSETPDTDTYMAEVRAQDAEECVRQLVISDDDDFSDAPNICAMVAHQLRQDANNESPSMLSEDDCQSFVRSFTKGAAQ